jgi:hypothetical protein
VVPETPDLDAALKDFKSDVTISRGEAFDPSPANIEARIKRAKLANGMKVVMLRKRTANIWCRPPSISISVTRTRWLAVTLRAVAGGIVDDARQPRARPSADSGPHHQMERSRRCERVTHGG